MPRRTGKENLHPRVVEMDVKERKEVLNKKEAVAEATLKPVKKAKAKKSSALSHKRPTFEDLEPEAELDYEDCIEDLPSDLRKALINGSWGND